MTGKPHLTDEQLARVEALEAARKHAATSGPFGDVSKAPADELIRVAEWILASSNDDTANVDVDGLRGYARRLEENPNDVIPCSAVAARIFRLIGDDTPTACEGGC